MSNETDHLGDSVPQVIVTKESNIYVVPKGPKTQQCLELRPNDIVMIITDTPRLSTPTGVLPDGVVFKSRGQLNPDALPEELRGICAPNPTHCTAFALTPTTEAAELVLNVEKNLGTHDEIRLTLIALPQEVIDTEDPLSAQARAHAEELSALTNDFARVRARLEQNTASANDTATEQVVAAFLPLIDAIAAAAAADTNAQSLDALTQQILRALDITPLGSPGEAFDPLTHEAIAIASTETQHPHNTIDPTETTRVADVVRRGYARNGTLIRPAAVIVTEA